jgi:putative acetyltransferase
VTEIRRVITEQEIALVRALWSEYWETLGLPLEFQGFAAQLQRLPGEFAGPAGLLMLAFSDSIAAGTIAVRPLRPDACEAKRLYVRPPFRAKGIGKKLLSSVIENARSMGYQTMYVDTLSTMHEAARLYQGFAFQRVEAYSPNPTPGAIYFRRVL